MEVSKQVRNQPQFVLGGGPAVPRTPAEQNPSFEPIDRVEIGALTENLSGPIKLRSFGGTAQVFSNNGVAQIKYFRDGCQKVDSMRDYKAQPGDQVLATLSGAEMSPMERLFANASPSNEEIKKRLLAAADRKYL